MKRQSGMSLVELLISLFLSTLILSSLGTFYLQIKRQYLQMRNLLEQSIEIQWAIDLMSDSIKRAGFTPCLGIEQLKTSPKLKGLVIHHQVLQINRMSEFFTESLKMNLRTLKIPRNFPINRKRRLLIADCEHAETQTIQDYHSGQITLKNPLQFTYPFGAFIGEWIEEQWFIKKNLQQANSLYYKRIDTEELSPFIKGLAVEKQLTPEGKTRLHLNLSLAKNDKQSVWVSVRG